MRIKRATVAGFQGVSTATLELGRVNVFVGANGSGKTTMLEALLMPIFGVSRAPKKKDWPKMIREGMRSAEVSVRVEDEASGAVMAHDLAVKIMRSRTTITPLKKPDLFDRVLLDPLAFFDLPAKVKADLVGDVPLRSEDVEKALKAHGLDGAVLSDTVNIVMMNRLAGAEAVLRDRRLAAYRAIEDPGPEPQFMWQGQPMAAPSYDQYNQEYLPTLQNWRATSAQLEAEARNARTVAAQVATRDQAIREAMYVINRINVSDMFLRQAELDQTATRLQGMHQRYAALSRQLQSMHTEPCPHCGQPYAPGSGEVNRELQDLSTSIAAEEAPHQALLAERAQWQARREEVQLAQQKLEANRAIQLPAMDVEDIQLRLRDAQDKTRDYETWVNTVADYFSKLEFWNQRKTACATAKETRAQWDKAVKILENPAFKAELVTDPLERVRRRLLKTGQIFQRRVDVSDDLSVTADGRDWWLLSEAQKLETSVMLADAFAHAGGCRILKIDGVDTLVGSYQLKLLAFIREVMGDYDTILLALASEQTPVIYQQLFSERQNTPGYAPLARWFWLEENQCLFKEEL
jgi:hypothetical protein